MAVLRFLLCAIGIAAEKFDQGAVLLQFLEGGGDLLILAVAGEVDVDGDSSLSCLDCDDTIKNVRLSGRQSAFCPTCQPENF